MIDTHFGNVTSFGSFSRYYLRNDHYNCSVDVLEVSSQSNRDPWGGKSDIYIEGYANGQPFCPYLRADSPRRAFTTSLRFRRAETGRAV